MSEDGGYDGGATPLVASSAQPVGCVSAGDVPAGGHAGVSRGSPARAGHAYAPELADVLVAFFWLSAFVCFMAVVVLVLLGVSVFTLMKPRAARQLLVSVVVSGAHHVHCLSGAQGVWSPLGFG